MWRKSVFPALLAAAMMVAMPLAGAADKSGSAVSSKSAKAKPDKAAVSCVPRADLKDKDLCGSWTLVSTKDPAKQVGTLSADGKFFTIRLDEPAMDLTATYTQAPTGEFRCTIIDKQVLIVEGRFSDANKIDFGVGVKQLGKPDVTRYEMLAVRDGS